MMLFQAERTEDFVRAYLYWAPHNFVSATVEFQYEQLEIDDIVRGEGFQKLDTYRLPLGLRFFHPCGFFAGITASYVYQKGDFYLSEDPTAPPDTENLSDDFWIVDAGLGYRLPKRYGVISLEFRNLFDQSFNYQNIDLASPRYYPERHILGKITLKF
jgi:hypothetical protein